MRKHNALTVSDKKIRYVVTEDSDIKRGHHWENLRGVVEEHESYRFLGILAKGERWLLIVCAIVGASALAYFGLGYVDEGVVVAAAEEGADLTIFDTAPEICTGYDEEVSDCTEVSTENMKSNGCGYYYELQMINEVNHASACYNVVGTDSCARNEGCSEELVTTLNIASESLSCTDYQEEVDDCTYVSVDDIKDNGCGHYYEAQTVDDVDYASACYCVVGTDSCAMNDACAEEI